MGAAGAEAAFDVYDGRPTWVVAQNAAIAGATSWGVGWLRTPLSSCVPQRLQGTLTGAVTGALGGCGGWLRGKGAGASADNSAWAQELGRQALTGAAVGATIGAGADATEWLWPTALPVYPPTGDYCSEAEARALLEAGDHEAFRNCTQALRDADPASVKFVRQIVEEGNCGRWTGKHADQCVVDPDLLMGPLSIENLEASNRMLTDGRHGSLRKGPMAITCAENPLKACETSEAEARATKTWNGLSTRGFLVQGYPKMTLHTFKRDYLAAYSHFMEISTGVPTDLSDPALSAAVVVMNKVRDDPEHWGYLEFPAPERVPTLLRSFVDWYNALLEACHNNTIDDQEIMKRIAELEVRFIEIHPFRDGNGRTARALLSSLTEQCLGWFSAIQDPSRTRSEPFSRVLGNVTRIHEAVLQAYAYQIHPDQLVSITIEPDAYWLHAASAGGRAVTTLRSRSGPPKSSGTARQKTRSGQGRRKKKAG